MKVSIVLGSGVSYYSGVPNIKDMTLEILNANNVVRHTDMNYYILSTPSLHQDWHVLKCKELINIIKDKNVQFYDHIGVDHSSNYEDIYYVLRQITDSYAPEYENPGIMPYIEYILHKMQIDSQDLNKWANEAIMYIECMVRQLIKKPITQLNQFDIINDIREQFQLNAIFSLNHDMLLEKWCDKNGIQYDDGFDYYKGKGLKEWVGHNKESDILKLYKMHGSIDWYYFGIRDSEGQYNNYVKIPTNIYPERASDIDSNFVMPIPMHSDLLIGTFNKMLYYLSSIYETIYDEFKLAINQAETIIISGYGFGDKGINTKLANWLNRATSIRMIIIHPDKDELLKNSRGSFKNIFYQNNDKVKIILKKFEDVTIEDIM